MDIGYVAPERVATSAVDSILLRTNPACKKPWANKSSMQKTMVNG